MLRRASCVLIVLTFFPALASARGKLDRAAVEAIAKDSLDRWQAPGLAVAVVLGDEVFVGGFGVREKGKAAPVTPDTIFALASITKAFTATAVGILADDGKAGWDDPVRKHLDWFRLKDPLADRAVTLRDLLCHRAGLARHDILWYRAPWPVEETVRRMAHLEPAGPFRARYQYNNLGYAAVGLAVEKAAGKPWHEFVRERIFTPLGMKNAVFTAAEVKALPDHAAPHRGRKPISWYPDEKQIRASGSIKASVRDLVPWLRMQLGGGEYEGRRIVSAESLAETHRPQVVAPMGAAVAKMTESTQSSYALGWHVADYRGYRVIDHGGANDGFRGRVILVPKAKLGVALLTNCEEGDMIAAAGNHILDRLLDLKPKDWAAFYKKKPGVEAAKVARKAGTKQSRELSAYAGKYREAAYGELVVEEQGKELHLAWSSFRVPLAHFHYDTFQAKGKGEANRRMDGELATFALGEAGDVEQVKFLGRTFRR